MGACMYVLGICGGIRAGHHDGAAVLFEGGRLIAAAEEERFLRVKHAMARLPENAIRYCLDEAGIGMQDVHAVGYNYATIEHIGERLVDFFRFRFGHSRPADLPLPGTCRQRIQALRLRRSADHLRGCLRRFRLDLHHAL